jgi:endonuclease/exonuclease/phosphatase family metal-dependent hydrolase
VITRVYEPQEDSEKIEFISEIRDLQCFVQDKWLILGDFNLIRRAREKSNSNVNLRMMGHFCAAIDDLELIEFPLLGCRFTWSNEREEAAQSRIDRVFVSKEWDSAFLHFQLTPASMNVSDHYPIMLKNLETFHYKGFRFETHWLKGDGLLEVVDAA